MIYEYFENQQREDEYILKNNAYYTMPNQNLQICVVILVINVMMSGIRSSPCFDVNVPIVNDEKKTSPYCLSTDRPHL